MEREEAIRRIKAWNLDPDDREVLATIIPELAESEDERIRKELIEFIQWFEDRGMTRHDFHQAKRPSEWIDYLEKQKEPVVDKEGMYYYLGGKFIYCGYPATEENPYDFAMSQQEKQKEQKTVEFTHHETNESLQDAVTHQMEDDGDVDDFVRRGIDDIALKYAELGAKWQKEQIPVEIDEYEIIKKHITHDSLSSEVNKRLKECGWYFIEELVEWREEDQKSLNRAINICTSDFVEDCQTTKFLKSLPERFDLQPKQEWSEEDEKDMAHIIRILDDCYAYGKHDLSKTDHENLVGTLKSLRPSWKPSEEQMEALNALLCIGDFSYVGQATKLQELYIELKKL